MTTNFTIYPAIDLRKGQVVRLQHGDPNRQTVFGDDPVAVAKKWVADGATWLHVVNLDGAFDEAGLTNWQLLPRLAELGVHIQFGGGIRSLSDMAYALGAGATRLVLGTLAVEQPALVAEAVRRFGAERVVVGIDARSGRVKTRGWQTDTAISPVTLGQQMYRLGIRTVIHTDISRDGVLTGVNAVGCAELAQATGLEVIASGGVASLSDIEQTAQLADKGVVGVVVGRALYDGRVNLQQAISQCAHIG